MVIDLADLRRTVGVTQMQLAAAISTTQGQISRIEHQADMLISTMASYLAALGVDAKIVIETAEGTVTYDLTTQEGQE